MAGSNNLFTEAQTKLKWIFENKFGLDHDKATKAQVVEKLKEHGGEKAFKDIQHFFNEAYENFFNFENFQAEFCSMGALADLSNVGKIIINIGDFCDVSINTE